MRTYTFYLSCGHCVRVTSKSKLNELKCTECAVERLDSIVALNDTDDIYYYIPKP